ncbi:hypothetical protein GCM10023183_08310 [Nibribacter koreensis]|uniref:Por secretion system C-terminal sorting domain-containing protein n=1 Tax=Nibribacter koreensis TaxID=1084519 RepID=A0ABP8FBB4_9BACT
MIEWDRVYGGSEGDYLEIVRQTSDGGYIVGGYTIDPEDSDIIYEGHNREEFLIFKVDATGEIEWKKFYGGLGPDLLMALEQTSDGGYILGGTSSSDISGDKSEPLMGSSDYWVLKLDANGDIQWQQTVGGNAAEFLNDVIQTSDGGYLLGGHSYSGISGDKTQASRGGYDYWVVKLNAIGATEWDKTYGGNGADLLNSVLETSDGGFLLGGGSTSHVGGDVTSPQKVYCEDECYFNFWVVKIDADGMKEWDRMYGATGGETGQSIVDMVHTQDGGYLLGGSSDSDANFDKSEPNKSTYSDYMDYWVVKINATGDIQWDRTLGGDGIDRLGALLATSDGGYLVGGSSRSGVSDDKTEPSRDTDVNNSDYWVVKLDAMGAKLWDKTIGGSGDDELSSIDLASDGGYYVGGSSDTEINGDKTHAIEAYDFWIVKLREGECVPPSPAISLTPSDNTYTGGVASNLYLGYGPQSITLTAGGGLNYYWSPVNDLTYISDSEYVFTPTAPGVYTFSVTARVGECTATTSVTINVVDVRCGAKNSKVMLCHNGKMLCVEDGAVKAHLKNHPEDRLGECNTETTIASHKKSTMVQVYPNPFTSTTGIALDFTEPQQYTVEVYDGKGTLMQRWPSGKAKAGEQVRLYWTPKHGEKGLYIVRVITQDGVQTKQVVRE